MNGLQIMITGRSTLLFTAVAALAAGAAAQTATQAQPQSQPKPAPRAAPVPQGPAGALNPGNPDYKPPVGQAEAQPAPLPPVIWDPVSAQDLIYYIQQVGKEGLNPADYDAEGLGAALRSGDPAIVSREATERFNRLSSDLALGHVKRAARVDWTIPDGDLDAARQDALLREALATRRLGDALNGLLPTHPQYAALKSALEMTPAAETAKIGRIRINLDRWRWLPRDLGQKYIIVNVPGFHATLVENGVNRWKERAIAGALRTPTPQLTATATGVILNPWWEVPKSIEPEVRGKKGFVPFVGKDGKVQRWRQPPGATNALGQLKFVMPNSKAIYLHDTNARSRFNDRARALSHGCIRTQHIVDLATTLLGDDEGTWTPAKVQATLASKKSVQASFVKPLPVYIVYFSAAGLNDGRIVDYRDIYGRDAKAIAALNAKDGGAGPVKPKAKAKVVASR